MRSRTLLGKQAAAQSPLTHPATTPLPRSVPQTQHQEGALSSTFPPMQVLETYMQVEALSPVPEPVIPAAHL